MAGFTAVQLYRIRWQPGTATFDPVAPKPIAAAELAGQLLAARSPAERRAALASLSGIEARAAPAVAAALATSLEQRGRGPQVQRSRIAAIHLLARNAEVQPEGAPGWLELLERCQQDPLLREAALRARALLGDALVLEELAAVWIEKLERHMFLARLVRARREPAARLLVQRSRADLTRCADGLRHLAQDRDKLVFERLAEAYWESWSWLGQGPGDRFADELFTLARLDEGTLQFRPQDVRGPRDAMKRVAQRGSAAARAAAGLILAQRGPQYTTLCATIGDTLAQLLPECEPLDQQRLTWAIMRLQGRLFGNIPSRSPLDVSEQELAAALRWARPGEPPALKGPCGRPPILIYRAVTAERLLERDLMQGLQGGWQSAQMALDRWLAADLGCTPRLRRLLHPGQRHPDYAALTAAMIIVAACDERAMRPQLQLWREAREQPVWVRALAYTVLGSFDAHSKRWDSGWPAGLNLGDTTRFDQGTPGWEHFGRVLAVGGPSMVKRLRRFRPAPLPVDAQTKLLEAAKHAADH